MNTLRKADIGIAVAAVCALTTLGTAAAAPMEIGVGTHFGHNKANLTVTKDFLTASGIQSIRDDVSWGMSEDAKGVLAVRDGTIKLRQAIGQLPTMTKPVYVFGYGNNLYDGGGLAKSPAALAAYARFVSTILPQMPYYSTAYVELWNEWNIGAGSKPFVRSGVAQDYTNLVLAAAPAVRKAAPKAKILVGSLAEDFPDWTFAKSLIKQGALDAGDGLSVHVYNHCGRAGSDEAIARLDTLRGYMVSAGKGSKPIYVTEFGWPSNTGSCGIAEADGALYTLRFLMEASTREWIGGVWLYELLESGTDPADRESRFGVVRLVPGITNNTTAAITAPSAIPATTLASATKPMGCVMKSMTKLIAQRPLKVASGGGLRAALFSDGTRRVVGVWNATTTPLIVPKGTLTLNGTVGNTFNPLAVCNVTGGTMVKSAATSSSASFAFTLKSGAPLLLELGANASISGIEIKE